MVPQHEPNTYDKQLVALGRVLQILREEENSDTLIETVLTYLRSEMDYPTIWLGLYDRMEHRILGKGGVIPNGDANFLKQRIPLAPGDIFEQVVIQQRPVAVPDLQEEPRAGEWRRAAQKANVRGTVIFPMRYRDRCYGVALLGSAAWGVSPKSEEKARLSIILGELAASLYKIETEWQRQQVKQPTEPLLQLLNQLRSLHNLGARLEAVVESTQQFIQPTRTSLYWYEGDRRYFWRRVGNRARNAGMKETTNLPSSGITVQEVSGFYQALLADSIVSIGEAHSSLKADITARLMKQIKARSLLAAPILYQNELLGFLAVEGNDPRIWNEHEKQFIRGAAQMVALTTPLDEMEVTIERIRADQDLKVDVARLVYAEDDWRTTLRQTADQLCKRLKAERFVVLLHDPLHDRMEICYQSQPSNRRPLPNALDLLSETDWQWIRQSTDVIPIENLSGELKLIAWRDRLLELGLSSVILCNTAIAHDPDGLVLIGHEAPRSWSRQEQDLIKTVTQQIGLILHQWQLFRQSERQQRTHQALQTGLATLQQSTSLDSVDRHATEHLAQLMQVPLALLIAWTPGDETGQIVTSPPPNERFNVNASMKLPLQSEALVQWAIGSPEMFVIAVEDLPPDTRQWLYGTGIGQVLIYALRPYASQYPVGVVVLADEAGRRWEDSLLSAFRTLVEQVAWARYHLLLSDRLTTQRTTLEQLTWYKHRRVEASYRVIAAMLHRLEELGNPKDPLFATRQQQLLRQIQDAIAPLAALLKTEVWSLQSNSGTISLLSLLRRSLERVDPYIKERQLWSQVHDETNLTLGGDIGKIELVLYEVLLAACLRSPNGGRIDLWCRQVDIRWFELLITDSGQMEPQLLQALAQPRIDWLTPSWLDTPPGLHLIVCQALMKFSGGEANFYKLDDGRITTRLVIPLGGRA